MDSTDHGTLTFSGEPIVFDAAPPAETMWLINHHLLDPRKRTPRGPRGRRMTWSYPRYVRRDGVVGFEGFIFTMRRIGFESKAYGRFKRRQMQRRRR